MILYVFVLTFMTARIVVFLIMDRMLPDMYLHVKGTHIHHLNYGIFLLSGVGGYVLVMKPVGLIGEELDKPLIKLEIFDHNSGSKGGMAK